MAEKKIAKRQGQTTTGDTPDSIARALFDLENNVPELKKDLKPLQITDAKEVCVGVRFLHIYGLKIYFLFFWNQLIEFFYQGCHSKFIDTVLIQFDLKYELGGGKKAIVIYVPVPLLKQFHKVQQ